MAMWIISVVALTAALESTFSQRPAPSDADEALTAQDADANVAQAANAADALDPTPLPDLRIDDVQIRECLSLADETNPGTMTVSLSNAGAGRTGGVLLYVEADVTNQITGASARFFTKTWEDDVAAGASRVYTLTYGFPLADHYLTNPVVSHEPVPGSYLLHIVVDKPSELGLELFRATGIVEESDEANNVVEIESDGMPDGLC